MKNISQQLQEINPNILISAIKLPENHSLNDMWVNYGLEAIKQLMNESNNAVEVIVPKTEENALKQISEGKLTYETSIGTFYVLGNISTDLGTLKASIFFEEIQSKRKHRAKPDLYDRNQLLSYAKTISEAEQHLNINQVEAELMKLTDLLEAYRDNQLKQENGIKNKTQNLLPPEKEKEAIEFLSQANVIGNIDKLIETSGIVGEANNRKMVFVIASTYKMLNPLHALVQGTSGSGKTHLINAIANLMPPEDKLNMTRITSKSLYNYTNDDLVNKLITVQDIDGLDDEAMFAFRELQSAGGVSSSTTYKNKQGQLVSTIKHVKAKFASLVATTHAPVLCDGTPNINILS